MYPAAVDPLEQAHAVVASYAGEGLIAFPEPVELMHPDAGVTEEIAIQLAQKILRDHAESDQITVYLGRVGNEDEVSRAEAISIIEDPSWFRYGDGGEMRAFFVVPASFPRCGADWRP